MQLDHNDYDDNAGTFHDQEGELRKFLVTVTADYDNNDDFGGNDCYDDVYADIDDDDDDDRNAKVIELGQELLKSSKRDER